MQWQLIARLRYKALLPRHSTPRYDHKRSVVASLQEARVCFQGGAFAGTTEVAQTEVNGRLRLNLGLDRSEDEISGGWFVFEKRLEKCWRRKKRLF